MSLAIAILRGPIEGETVVKAHAVLAHQLPIEVSEAKRGQLLASERQVRGLREKVLCQRKYTYCIEQ